MTKWRREAPDRLCDGADAPESSRAQTKAKLTRALKCLTSAASSLLVSQALLPGLPIGHAPEAAAPALSGALELFSEF